MKGFNHVRLAYFYRCLQSGPGPKHWLNILVPPLDIKENIFSCSVNFPSILHMLMGQRIVFAVLQKMSYKSTHSAT